MADLAKYELDDGSTVSFESAGGSLVSLRGGEPDIVDAGELGDRLQQVATAAGQVADRCAPHWPRTTCSSSSASRSLGRRASDFFATVSGEGSISVTLTWRKPPSP